jgi:DNA-binding MarR family transcriptional regulator
MMHPDQPEPADADVAASSSLRSDSGTTPGLAWTEIGQFAEALTFARRALFTPVEAINAEYALGQRGIWVIGMIASGRIRTHADIARHFGIPKSVVTEQIALLVSQDLVTTTPAPEDRRQKNLALSDRGRALNARLGAAFEQKFDQLLGRFTAQDLRLCTELLNELAGTR